MRAVATATHSLGVAPRRRARARRTLTEEEGRTYRRIPAQVDYVPHPAFSSAHVTRDLFGEEAGEIRVPTWQWPAEVGAPFRGAAPAAVRLGPEQERTLFLRYNYARYRLSCLLPAQHRRYSASRAREMVLWWRRALKARSDLVRANLPLVLAMAKRTRVTDVEFAELASEGNMALLRSIEKFDASRGLKFSTYACRAVLKSFHRLAQREGRQRHRFTNTSGGEFLQPDPAPDKHDRQWEDSIYAIRRILAENLAALSDLERQILTYRFGLATGQRGLTLAQIGEKVGFSNERVRQILKVALRKLRVSLSQGFLVG